MKDDENVPEYVKEIRESIVEFKKLVQSICSDLRTLIDNYKAFTNEQSQ